MSRACLGDIRASGDVLLGPDARPCDPGGSWMVSASLGSPDPSRPSLQSTSFLPRPAGERGSQPPPTHRRGALRRLHPLWSYRLKPLRRPRCPKRGISQPAGRPSVLVGVLNCGSGQIRSSFGQFVFCPGICLAPSDPLLAGLGDTRGFPSSQTRCWGGWRRVWLLCG